MNIFLRKINASIITVLLSIYALSLLFVGDSEFEYHHAFLGWSGILVLFVSLAVFVYGSIVSFCIETIKNKLFNMHYVIYVLLHGIFGLVNGLLFKEILFAIIGFSIATLYAIIDIWLSKRKSFDIVKWFVVAFIIAFSLTWIFLALISPEKEPFTKKDALELVLIGEEGMLELFPTEQGTTDKEIDGYKVIFKTSVFTVDQESGIYQIRFKANWSKETEKGYSEFIYEVQRGQSRLLKINGEMPPFMQHK